MIKKFKISIDKNLDEKWYIAQIKPNSYHIAVQNLERQGFQAFLPKTKTTIKKENKFIDKEVLIFPGYAFVGMDRENSDWVKINSTFGVSKLLTFNKKPSEVHPHLIFELKNRYEDNANPIINEKLKTGDTIKFNKGPFVNLIANIESVEPKKRIYILLEVMGGPRKLEINLKERMNFIKI